VVLDGGEELDVDVVVLAAGRRPRSAGLGLEALGIPLAENGAVPIDERCQVTRADRLWAIGDVTGVAPFTHTAHYQGRVVAANLAGRDTRADYRAIPRAVYTSPAFVAVGHTVSSARAAGIEPMVADTAMSQAVRSTTEGEPEGWLRMLSDPATGGGNRSQRDGRLRRGVDIGSGVDDPRADSRRRRPRCGPPLPDFW
jgi:dihydrolipoamide dehydrogenase